MSPPSRLLSKWSAPARRADVSPQSGEDAVVLGISIVKVPEAARCGSAFCDRDYTAFTGLLVSARFVSPCPTSAPVGDRETSIVVSAQLDPVAAISRSEVEIGDERVWEIVRPVDERLVQLPDALDFAVLPHAVPCRWRATFVRAVVDNRDPWTQRGKDGLDVRVGVAVMRDEIGVNCTK